MPLWFDAMGLVIGAGLVVVGWLDKDKPHLFAFGIFILLSTMFLIGQEVA